MFQLLIVLSLPFKKKNSTIRLMTQTGCVSRTSGTIFNVMQCEELETFESKVVGEVREKRL